MTQTKNKNNGYLYTFPKGYLQNDVNSIQINTVGEQNKQEIIKVIMADDHPYLIHGVEADLNKDPRIKVIASADSYDVLLEKNKTLKPDIILLDLKMPGREKYDLKDLIPKLKSDSQTQVVVFSNETGWARIHKCLELGACAYIEKAISLGRLIEFIHKITDGNEFLIFTAEQLPQVQFSPRQKAILHYIVNGKENDEISQNLEIEVKTVQSYVNEIKEKLSEAFGIHPIRPRTLVLLATKLGFGEEI